MKKKNILPILIFLSTLSVACSYFLYIRPQLGELYKGTASTWLAELIEKIYPRFAVERQRFPMEFFREKADQVIIRFSLLALSAIILLLLNQYSERMQKIWKEMLRAQTSLQNVSVIRILFPLALIWIYKDVWWDLASHAKLQLFYKPVLILKLLHIPYPDLFFISAICVLFFVSCLMIIFNRSPMIFSCIAGLIFLLIEGLLNSFEKTDHGDATLTYCAMIFPFLMMDHEKAFKAGAAYQDKWALSLVCFLICLAYLQSGLEKILTGGIAWLSPETLRNYILLHHAPLGVWVAQYDLLLIMLSLTALLFQLSFIFILRGRFRIFFLLAGVIFHIGVFLLLDVGWYINSWILSYLFFIEWDTIASKISRRLPSFSKVLIPGKK